MIWASVDMGANACDVRSGKNYSQGSQHRGYLCAEAVLLKRLMFFRTERNFDTS